ncbi:MAG: hypothetical protein H0V29_09580 [Thermoleophilaceae bacterium]|nr:hypothetical protein [Thermoleophilaceae bacterium]
MAALPVLVLALPAVASAAPKKTETTYYVALGDSWAAGCVPDLATGKTACPRGGPAGYVAQVYKSLKAKNPGLKLKSVACPGETTQSLLTGKGNVTGKSCAGGSTQIKLAEKFMKENKGKIAYVTMVIGGNNVVKCVPGGKPDVACIGAGFTEIDKDVPTIAKRVKKAAGKGATVVGSGYNDPFLSLYTKGDEESIGIANLSITLTKTLQDKFVTAYGKSRIKVADVRKAFDTDNTAPSMFQGKPYPTNVVKLCENSLSCDPKTFGNIHPDKSGYKIVADTHLPLLR